MSLKNIYKILNDYASGKLSDSDFEKAMTKYKHFFPNTSMPELTPELENSIWNGIKRQSSPIKIIPFKKRLLRYVAAVSGIFIFITGIYTFTHKITSSTLSLKNKLLRYERPLTDTSWTLMASDGKQFSLDKIQDNIIYDFDGQKISKHKDTLIYLKTNNAANGMHVPSQRIVHLRMNDGTMITANANTTLSYNTDYTQGGGRMLAIDGEALFRVIHNARNPFAVITDKDTLFDIGTSFTVKSFLGDSMLLAGVTEGCVRLKSSLILKGNEIKVSYSQKQTLLQKRSISSTFFWNSDVFSFRQANMEEVVHSLERWYGIKIKWNRTSNFTFSGDIPKTLSPDKVLNLLNELSEDKLSIIS